MAINMSLWRIPLSTWKKTPGLFLYALLVINPFVRERPERRFVMGLMSAGAVGIEVAGKEGGVEGEGVTSGIMRGMLKVQEWLGCAGDEVVLQEGTY